MFLIDPSDGTVSSYALRLKIYGVTYVQQREKNSQEIVQFLKKLLKIF